MDKHCLCFNSRPLYSVQFCIYLYLMLRWPDCFEKKNDKRHSGNCKSVDSPGHVNYTVPVMIIVSLCFHVCLFFRLIYIPCGLVGCSCFPGIVDFFWFIAAVFLWFESLFLSFITFSVNKHLSLYFALIICLFPGVSLWFLVFSIGSQCFPVGPYRCARETVPCKSLVG